MIDWLTSEDNRLSVAALGVLLVSVCSMLFSKAILPENCLIIETRDLGLLCDGFNFDGPTPCAVCQNEDVAAVARIFVLFGIVFLFIGPMIVWIRGRIRREEDGKISIVEN